MSERKTLEDTQDIDVKAVRKAVSRTKKGEKSKKEYSKGGSFRERRNSNSPVKKTVTARSAESQKPSNNKTKSNENKSKKIRYFPMEQVKKAPQKKKTASQKRNLRKIKGIAVFLLIAITIIASLTLIAINQLFKIKTIQINYELPKTSSSLTVKRRYSDDRIIKASSTGKGKNLVFLNSEKVSESIENNLPYLKIKSIDKKGFSSLIISVKQIEPVYAFEYGSSYVLSDYELEVVDVTEDKKSIENYTLVRFASISDAQTGEIISFNDYAERQNDKSLETNKYKNDLMTIFSGIKASGLKKITDINLKDINDIYMTYDSRIVIHFGSRQKLLEKMKLASKSLEAEDKNSTSQKGTLNMTIDKKAYFTAE